MWSLFAGLLSSFAILTSASSLPPSLYLVNSNSTGISNYNNQTLPNLLNGTYISCHRRYGEGMSLASCRNALQKISTSVQITTPIRYLSDDGICAVVCCPCLLLLFHSASLWFYKAVMNITRALNTCL